MVLFLIANEDICDTIVGFCIKSHLCINKRLGLEFLLKIK